MTFDTRLDGIIALLQRQGRVSYRALKRRFNLDDETLKVLKDELINVQHVAVDEDGRVLVWAEDAHASGRGEPPQSTPEPPEAERRQLTVLFCHLVDSTYLSSQLDPEDWRDIIHAYQRTCTEVITRFDGYIAQYLDDGLLVYFGYPQAHEDDAQRAVRGSLHLLEALRALRLTLPSNEENRLAVRLGIHTGLVVVNTIRDRVRHEQQALGETLHIAARIQSIATPDTVVISASTYELIQGYFLCQSLGPHRLRGVSRAIPLYQVREASGARSRLDVAAPRGLTPLVGRQNEIRRLLKRWDQVKAGMGQAILLTGEAGIGKSRLVQVLKEQLAEAPHTVLECRCSPYDQHSALYAVLDMWERNVGVGRDDTPETKRRKLERTLSQYNLPLPETVPLFACLLSLPLPEDQYPPLTLTPQSQRHKTLETIVSIWWTIAARQPLLFIVEDLHWADPSTLELLTILIDRMSTVPILMLLTGRPEFRPAWLPHPQVTQTMLNRLSPAQVEVMIKHVAGDIPLPSEIIRQMVVKTDGIPLFAEELTRTMVEAGWSNNTEERPPSTASGAALSIPLTLQDSLMARLDRLPTAKGVAQLGATIGRQFSIDLLRAVGQLDDQTLQRELQRLVGAGIVYQQDLPTQTTYIFKHALLRDAAYESLLKSTRQRYHHMIAQVLETHSPETVMLQPELLAHHYTEAGAHLQAARYWQQAGEQAVSRYANREAIDHLSRALELLHTLPRTAEHLQRELTLQITLGPANIALKGYAAAEVEHAYTRARQLCQEIGDTSQLFPVLVGLRRYYQVRAEYHTAYELGEQILTMAQQRHDPAWLLEAYFGVGITTYYLGAFATSQAHCAQGLALYEAPPDHIHAVRLVQDPGVTCHLYAALGLWGLGYPEQALHQYQAGLTLARRLRHPFSLAFALGHGALVHVQRREGSAAHAVAEEVRRLAQEQDYAFWWAWGTFLHGWAIAAQGDEAAGIAQMHQGLDAAHATGARVGQSVFLTLLAEAYGHTGRPEEGLSALDDALAVVQSHGEQCYEAEIWRLKGELLLTLPAAHDSEAEPCFQRALSIARSQQAKTFELRTATSLSRLWRQQGKRQAARELLAETHGWFTEGFNTADLQAAKALLDELSA